MTKFRIDKTRIDLLMVRAKMDSYKELAEKSGLHQNTLTRILRGETWTSETAEKLATALQCSPIDLLVTNGYPSPKWDALAAIFPN